MKPSLTISLIQSNLHWEDKQQNMDMFEKKIYSIAEAPEIIVLPEMFTTGFSMNPYKLAEPMNGATIEWMKRISTHKKCILTGSIMIEENGKYYNRLIWMQPNGEYGTYDKRHLFSYAGENQHFTAGDKRLITQVNGWKICPQICYDLRFPIWNRQAISYEFDVFLVVANWPQRRELPWNTLLRARSIENQCYVIGSNRVGTDGNGIFYAGDSQVINPLGELLYHKSENEDLFTMTLLKQEIESVRTQFPFLNDKDDFIIL